MRKPLLVLALLLVASPTFGVTERHVNNSDPNCSDGFAGTNPVQPKCTIQSAVTAALALGHEGDITTVHIGTYHECVRAVTTADATAANPWIIQGAPAEDANLIIIDPSTLDPATTCLETTSSCSIATSRAAITIRGNVPSAPNNPDPNDSAFTKYWRIQHLTVKPPAFTNAQAAMVSGIRMDCVSHGEILDVRATSIPPMTVDCAFDQAINLFHTCTNSGADADAIFASWSSYDLLIKGARVSNGGTIADGWHFFTGAIHVMNLSLVENIVKDLRGGFTNFSGGNGGSHLYMFNDVSNMGGVNDGDNDRSLNQYYNSANLRMAYNRFLANSVNAPVIEPRGLSSSTEHPSVIIHNNYMLGTGVGGGWDAIQVAQFSTTNGVLQAIIRNNLFEAWPTAINEYGPNATQVLNCDVRENNNACYNVTTCFKDSSTGCAPTLSPTSLSFTTPDPLNASDCPASGATNIVNAGDSTYPTPIGGTAPPDMGACEFGSGAGPYGVPYTFIPRTTTSTTPDLDWGGTAPANKIDMKPYDFKENAIADPNTTSQTALRCQIDTAYTFNSVGPGTPLWDSGTVSSSATSCTSGVTLGIGTYWARVQLTGGTRVGIWSLPTMFSVTSGSATRPGSIVMSQLSPGLIGESVILEQKTSTVKPSMKRSTTITPVQYPSFPTLAGSRWASVIPNPQIDGIVPVDYAWCVRARDPKTNSVSDCIGW